jgi:hypothetical protein
MSAMSRPGPAATHRRSARCRRVSHRTDSLYQSGSAGQGRQAGGTRVASAGVLQGGRHDHRPDRVIDGYDVGVAWGKPGRRTPWVDWLTKVEGEFRLVELP